MKENFQFEDKLKLGISYPDYLKTAKEEVEKLGNSEVNESNLLLQYTKLNFQRMERWNKNLELDQEVISYVKSIQNPLILLVISETWCGDAAHTLPVLAKMEEVNPNVTLKIVFRDQNLDLMDKYLTNGNRSIPKVIALSVEESSKIELFNWGPKPSHLMDKLEAFKSGELEISKEEFLTDTQRWYNQDKTKTIQKELIEKLKLSKLT